MREEIMAVKKELNELKEQSFAMELLHDSKRANKRICFSFTTVIIILIIGYFATVALFLKYISNINNEELTITNTKTQEVRDVNSIDNSNIINGDMYGYHKAN